MGAKEGRHSPRRILTSARLPSVAPPNTLNAIILHNLLIERELCIAKLQFVTERLDTLEGLIAEQRKKVESETAEKAA